MALYDYKGNDLTKKLITGKMSSNISIKFKIK